MIQNGDIIYVSNHLFLLPYVPIEYMQMLDKTVASRAEFAEGSPSRSTNLSLVFSGCNTVCI